MLGTIDIKQQPMQTLHTYTYICIYIYIYVYGFLGTLNSSRPFYDEAKQVVGVGLTERPLFAVLVT
jgi:hypothetical protein